MSTQPLIDRVRANARAFHPSVNVGIVAPQVEAMADKMRGTRFAAPQPAGEVALFGCLLLNAVNYCYWMGLSGYYPTGSGAGAMTKLVSRVLAGTERLTTESVVHLGERFVREIALSGVPLADRRIAHVREVTSRPGDTIRFIESITDGASAYATLENLVVLYPGFTGDTLLKRALLFVHLAHRVHGYFRPEELAVFPIPADYQVPKMLAHAGVLRYSPTLRDTIARGELIPAGSCLEIEIRAASIIACDQIATAAGITPGQVDDLLWGARATVTEPFHLTITTDY